MRLTIDWDDEEAKDENLARVNPDAVAGGQETLSSFGDARDTSNPWELRRSSSGDGYHYVEWELASDWNRITELRDEYGDDSKRLRLDLMRRRRGSPFLQVLYRIKYMDRWGWDPASGNQIDVERGTHFVEEDDRIKSPEGRLRYKKIAGILASREYGSQRALAESLDVASSTVNAWVNDRVDEISDPLQKKLRRRARSRGIGHYVETEGGGKSTDVMPNVETIYVDPEDKDMRRTIVEYADAPWDWDIGGDDREYALLNVHTGSYNESHSEPQLKHIHDDVIEHVLDQLSPTSPDGTRLDLDRDTVRPITREQDSVNYEEELIDPDETEFYLDNMTDRHGSIEANGGPDSDPGNVPLFEVILWDEDMTDLLWHAIGAWTGESISEATILKDDQGWL